eukprot:COSAG06_NODE_12765_length_1332_cov_23.748581_2_plen_177_part_00
MRPKTRRQHSGDRFTHWFTHHSSCMFASREKLKDGAICARYAKVLLLLPLAREHLVHNAGLRRLRVLPRLRAQGVSRAAVPRARLQQRLRAADPRGREIGELRGAPAGGGSECTAATGWTIAIPFDGGVLTLQVACLAAAGSAASSAAAAKLARVVVRPLYRCHTRDGHRRLTVVC